MQRVLLKISHLPSINCIIINAKGLQVKHQLLLYSVLNWVLPKSLNSQHPEKKMFAFECLVKLSKKGNGLLVEMIMNFSKNFTVLGFYHLLLRGHNPFLKHACKVGLSSEINNQRSLEFISQLQNIYLKLSFV